MDFWGQRLRQISIVMTTFSCVQQLKVGHWLLQAPFWFVGVLGDERAGVKIEKLLFTPTALGLIIAKSKLDSC